MSLISIKIEFSDVKWPQH